MECTCHVPKEPGAPISKTGVSKAAGESAGSSIASSSAKHGVRIECSHIYAAVLEPASVCMKQQRDGRDDDAAIRIELLESVAFEKGFQNRYTRSSAVAATSPSTTSTPNYPSTSTSPPASTTSSSSSTTSTSSQQDAVKTNPSSITADIHCTKCAPEESTSDGYWLCLHPACGFVGCARSGSAHVQEHVRESAALQWNEKESVSSRGREKSCATAERDGDRGRISTNSRGAPSGGYTSFASSFLRLVPFSATSPIAKIPFSDPTVEHGSELPAQHSCFVHYPTGRVYCFSCQREVRRYSVCSKCNRYSFEIFFSIICIEIHVGSERICS